jgi:site-specific DNA-methyltransferase (cytosine-N4-specific)
MLDGMNEMYTTVSPSLSSKVFNEDIRERGEWVNEGPFDLVITSPPYANSYDYYLYHKQRMNWIGLDFRLAKDREIGSRLEFSSHKVPVEKFFDDMTRAFANVASVLARGGRCIVVQGDSRIAGVMYSGLDTVRRVTNGTGLIIEDVQSMDLALTSKAFNPQFAVRGKKEHVVVLRRRDL